MTKRNFKSLIALVLLTLFLQACNIPLLQQSKISVEDQAKTIVVQTLTAQGNGGNDIQPTTEEAPLPSFTLTPTEISISTSTLTPTLDHATVTVSVDTNCRTGPGKIYDRVGGLLVGETAEVVGKSSEGNYWIIENPDAAGICWLWGYYATVVGSTKHLAIHTPPPTPTPIYHWTGVWTTSHGVTGFPHLTFIVTLTQTDNNVSGGFSDGGFTVTLEGSLSSDWQLFTGTWDDGGDSGPFEWKMISVNQFIGNRNNGDYEWCGARNGADIPSPCKGP